MNNILSAIPKLGHDDGALLEKLTVTYNCFP